MHNEEIKNKPNLIVIASNKRSGASMFACLFDGHPDIFHLIGETRFFVNFINVKNKNNIKKKEKIGPPKNLGTNTKKASSKKKEVGIPFWLFAHSSGGRKKIF